MEDIKFDFDRFMDDIVIKERSSQKRTANDKELTPMQIRNRTRRENVGNLIKFNQGGK